MIAFEKSNIISAADTFWNGYYPFIDVEAGGTIGGMINATKANLALANDTTKIVPGHGPIATKVELQEYQDMLVSIHDAVATLKSSGASVGQAMAAKPTASFDAKWGHYALSILMTLCGWSKRVAKTALARLATAGVTIVSRSSFRRRNGMKTSFFSKIPIMASCLLMPLGVFPQSQEVSLKHGIYVQEGVPCLDASFAMMKSWDGVGLSGPHSSKCTTRVLLRHNNRFKLRTTCDAVGDGTPLPPGQLDVQYISLLWLSATRFKLADETKRQEATFRWCSADERVPNVSKSRLETEFRWTSSNISSRVLSQGAGFFAGHLCGTSQDHLSQTGHLHVLRSGVLRMLDEDSKQTTIREPTVLLCPRVGAHSFQSEGADIVCAFVDFGAGMLNPLRWAIPSCLAVPLYSVPGLAPTIELLFTEAFGREDGRQFAVDRLTEYFLVILLRWALKSNLIQHGLLNALSDGYLSRAVIAIHQETERARSLQDLAHVAGMSRARFAAHFLETVGQTPFEYLAHCRIGIAQLLLKKGEPLKMVAPSVGYASAGALIRSFSQHVAMPPMAWLAA